MVRGASAFEVVLLIVLDSLFERRIGLFSRECDEGAMQYSSHDVLVYSSSLATPPTRQTDHDDWTNVHRKNRREFHLRGTTVAWAETSLRLQTSSCKRLVP